MKPQQYLTQFQVLYIPIYKIQGERQGVEKVFDEIKITKKPSHLIKTINYKKTQQIPTKINNHINNKQKKKNPTKVYLYQITENQ